MNRRECFIYGLFNSKGVCVYIGQTVNPAKRERYHLRNRKGKFYRRKLKFRIIRETIGEHIHRLENQIGNAYKRQGQATESRWFGGAPCDSINDGYLIESFKLDWTKTDREIAAIRGSSRAAANNLRNRLKSAGFAMPEIDYGF
jgi:predicted GIY-YIG superfamily endonuclease